MDTSFATLAMSTPTIVLSYAAAFFFVVVAIAAAYALFKAGGTLGRVDTVLSDVDREAVPLLKKAGTTLDGVNANLGNVDQITKDVADITDKIDAMATVVEGAVSTPARKAASFSAGVQGAVSSFMRRDKSQPAGGPAASGGASGGWTAPAADAAESFSDATAAAAAATAESASAAASSAADVAKDGAAAAGDAAEGAATAAAEAGRSRSPGCGDRHEGLSMGLSAKLVVSGAVAGAALTYYVRSRRARTGEGYLQIARSLPGDALRWIDDTKGHAAKALEEGKTAARERDDEFARQLLAAGAPPGA